MNSPIPVTILSGFLGSGKTTLLNYLLQNVSDEKIAVIENEFGEANIDGSLLTNNGSVSIIEMTNGCVCCSVRGEFAAALNDMLQKRAQGTLNFDRIIIETTGLADPSPVVQTFFVDENLREATLLDACITLADCEHILRQLDEHPVAAAQIAFADRILLTKIDRVGRSQRDDVVKRIHRINNKAPIFEITNGVATKDIWLDIHAFELSDDLSLTTGTYHIGQDSKTHFRQFGAAQAVTEQSWNDEIHSHYFEAGSMNIGKISAFMENLIDEHGNDMLRYKGIFSIGEEPHRLIIQGVHKVAAFDYGEPWRVDEKRLSRLIVIGRRLPVSDMRQAFENAQE